MREVTKEPVFKEKFGCWTAEVQDLTEEYGFWACVGQIYRTSRAEDDLNEEYSFFSEERADYRRAFDAIDNYMNESLADDVTKKKEAEESKKTRGLKKWLFRQG